MNTVPDGAVAVTLSLAARRGGGLCSECGRLATSPDGRDVVVPGKWHGKFPKEKATEEQLKHVGYKNLIR